MIQWFLSHVVYLDVWRKWRGVYLYVHLLPRYVYRVYWDCYRGFGADRFIKAKHILRRDE